MKRKEYIYNSFSSATIKTRHLTSRLVREAREKAIDGINKIMFCSGAGTKTVIIQIDCVGGNTRGNMLPEMIVHDLWEGSKGKKRHLFRVLIQNVKWVFKKKRH